MGLDSEIKIIEQRHVLPEKLSLTRNVEDLHLHPFARDDEDTMYIYYQSAPHSYDARVMAKFLKEDRPELNWAFGVGVVVDSKTTTTVDPESFAIWREWRNS